MSTETIPNQGYPVKRIPFIIFLILQVVLLFILIFSPAKISLAITVGLISLVFILIYPNLQDAIIILSIFIAIVLPRPTGRGLVFKVEEIFPLVALLLFIITLLQGETANRPIGKIGYWLMAFLIVVLISGIIGVIKERDKILIFDEAMMFWAWGMYFVVVKSNLTHKAIKHIIITIIIGSLIVSLYYIWGFRMLGGSVRFRTDQQHIFNVVIPILFAVLLYDTRNIVKILVIILLVPMVFAVYITLTRSLWLLIPPTIMWQYLYFIREKRKYNRISQTLFPLLIIFSIAFLGLVLFTQVFGIQSMFGERVASFRLLEYDFSLLARAELSRYVFERVRVSPFWGSGLADFLRYQYFPTLGRYNVYWLDGSFLQVLWKTGTIGLVLYLGFLYFFLKRSRFVLKKSHDVFDKIIGSGIFFSMIGLIINGIQSGIMIGYRFNFVWATLFGIIEIRAQELDKSLRNK